jgi:hypothetical protein
MKVKLGRNVALNVFINNERISDTCNSRRTIK